MRIVLQRVSRAAVTVGGDVVGAIEEPGLVALVGVTHDDDAATAAKLAEKTWTLRLLAGERSCADLGAPVLAISQFTLYGDARQGRRPAFTGALEPTAARALYEQALTAIRVAGVTRVEAGEFGADMKVELLNDGPVTILLDSRKLF